MPKDTEIRTAIMDTIHIDDEGLKDVKTLDINGLIQLGIKDVPSFLAGLLDAENDNDLNESDEDYVKGFKYGKTGAF